MFPNAGIMAAGVASGRTYEEFQAHIATLALDGDVQNGDRVPASNRDVRALVNGDTMNMYGSPWNTHFAGGNNVTQYMSVVRHCLPSEAEWNAQLSNGRRVYLKIQNISYNSTYQAVNRNGYQSQGITFTDFLTLKVTDFLFWDGTKAMRMNPSAGTGPTPYTW